MDFAASLAAALGRPLATGERLAVAVSGGPDSLALLALASAALPGRIMALTVDHRLRAAAAAEAAEVALLCTGLGVPHRTLAWTGAKPGAGLQAAARAARYRLLRDACADAGITILATAHHADDQAETLLMRLARGGGSAGLAGIRACRDLGGVMLVRPLLGERRSALAAIVAARGWTALDDPANHDPRHARTRARTLLAATPWLDPARAAATAAHLAAAEAALAWTADRAWAGRATLAADAIALDLAGLPADLVRRLVARAIAELAPGAAPRGPDLARLIARLAAGGSGTLAGVRGRGGNLWRFTPAPPRGFGAAPPAPQNAPDRP